MSVPVFSFTSRARPICEIGIGNAQVPTGQARWDVALWDAPTSTWAGDEPTWRDVSCYSQYADGLLGRGRVTDPFPVGTLDIAFDNATGWADPVITEVDGVLSVRPGRAIRLGVEHEVYGVRWLYRGFLDGVEPVFDPENPDWVMFRCIDPLGEAGRSKLAQSATVGADEFAHERVARILDAAPWPESKRDIDESGVRFVGAVLEGQVVDMLRRCGDSVGGAVFGDNEGNIVFRNQDWLYVLDSTPVDGTIGNGEGDTCPSGWRTPFARSDLATRVLLGRMMPPGSSQPDARTYDNLSAQRNGYGVEPWERLDLWTRDDADMDEIGTRVLAQRSSVTLPMVQGVSIDAATSDQAVDLLTTVDIWRPSRYRCRHVLPRGVVFDANYFATGITFHLERDMWTAEISLDKSSLYELPVLARWDEARWDRARWGA